MLTTITRNTTSFIRERGSAIALLLIVGFLFAPGVHAQGCGASNQRPCKVWERIPSCNKGLIEKSGKCRSKPVPICGAENQRACKVWERIPSCNKSLVESKGQCLTRASIVCGGVGEKPCPLNVRKKSCDKFLSEDFIKGQCVQTQAGLVHEAALRELKKYANALLSKAGDALRLSKDPAVVNGLRSANANTMNRKTKESINPCVLDVFNSWTLGGTGETSLILGGGLETGMSVDVSPAGRSGNQRPAYWYGDASYSLGLQVGSSAGINYGCWTAANNQILGAYHGITISVRDFAPVDLTRHKTLIDLRTASPNVDFVFGVWFSYDQKITEDSVLDIFPVKHGVGKFLGITLTPVFGQGVGVGPQYVRAYTGQFPGKQPKPTQASGTVAQNITGNYLIDGSSNKNEFRMIDNKTMEVRRLGSGSKWGQHTRISSNQFRASQGKSTYTVNANGTLVWKSNDARNLIVRLTPTY